MTDVRTRPYQRRRKGPIIAIVTVLAVAAVATWTTVLINTGGPTGAASCPAPAAGASPGEVLPGDALDTVAPVPPATVRVRVLNAGGQRGQANLVAAQLGDLGFAEAAPPDNDTFHPDGDMECIGQIRFGPAGEAAASTVALVLPCAELVRDDRTDATVDVSVGTAFGDLNPPRAGRNALEQLGGPSVGSDGSGNADPAGGKEDSALPPTVDQATLEEARSGTC